MHAYDSCFWKFNVKGLLHSEPFLISPTERASGDTAIFHVKTETVAIIHNIHHTKYAIHKVSPGRIHEADFYKLYVLGLARN